MVFGKETSFCKKTCAPIQQKYPVGVKGGHTSPSQLSKSRAGVKALAAKEAGAASRLFIPKLEGGVDSCG